MIFVRAGAEARGNNFLHAPYPHLYNVLTQKQLTDYSAPLNLGNLRILTTVRFLFHCFIYIEQSNCHHLRDASKMKPIISGLKSHQTSVLTFYLLLILDRKDGKLYLELSETSQANLSGGQIFQYLTEELNIQRLYQNAVCTGFQHHIFVGD
jgi:hypothetical protein